MQRWPAASITPCTSDFCALKSGWSSKIRLAQHDVASRSHFGLQSMRRRVNATFHKYLLHTLWHIWKFGMIRRKDHGLGNFLPISDVPAISHGLGQPFPVWVLKFATEEFGRQFFPVRARTAEVFFALLWRSRHKCWARRAYLLLNFRDKLVLALATNFDLG